MLVTHQHPFVLLPAGLITVALWLVPFLIYAISPTGSVLALSIVIAIILGVARAYSAWHSWNRTMVLLTTDRVIFLEQHGFFKRELIELPLKSVQQVSHAVEGLLGTLFGYGTISIAAIGTQLPLVIPQVPDPYAIQQEILQTQNGEGFIEEEEVASE